MRRPKGLTVVCVLGSVGCIAPNNLVFGYGCENPIWEESAVEEHQCCGVRRKELGKAHKSV